MYRLQHLLKSTTLLSAALLLALLPLAACNTTEGVGEDIQAAGEGIEDAAEDAN